MSFHLHKCGAKLDNHHKTGAVCGQIIGAAEGETCAECNDEHFCSLHHPDPEFHVEPTPPLRR